MAAGDPLSLQIFQVTVQRANGTPVTGATVRLLNAQNQDVTLGFFGDVSNLTNAEGVAVKYFSVFSRLVVGQYTIQVIAAGFPLWSFQTDADFDGNGFYTATLAPPANDPSGYTGYTMTRPPTVPMSSMRPIVVTIASPNGQMPWEYIRCLVQQPDGNGSYIEAPVDKLIEQVKIDFRNRIKLGIRPLLVDSVSLTRADTDFSTVVGLTFSSLSDEGETPLKLGSDLPLDLSVQFAGCTFIQYVAATYPAKGKTDLANYTLGVNQDWLLPPGPVIAFRGYYRDVMVWLPLTAPAGYVLTRTYYDRLGTQTSVTTDNLTSSPYVQRIKLNTDPVADTAKCVLMIKSGTVSVTKPLTVLYRD